MAEFGDRRSGSRWAAALAGAAVALACGGSGPGRLEVRAVSSAALGEEMGFSVLRPPVCSGAEEEAPHVVYLLHGYGGDHHSLDEEGLSDLLFVAQAEGRVPRVLMVMPEGQRGFYLNWHDGTRRYEDYLLEELIPEAERQLGIEVPRERRHIAGVSMGGYGALILGLRRPDLFASAASISGVIFDEDKAIDLAGSRLLSWAIDIDRMLGDGSDREFLTGHNPYSLIERLSEGERPRLFLASGSDEPEPLRRASVDFHERLLELGIDHEWLVYEGGHDWEGWARAIERAIAHAAGGWPPERIGMGNAPGSAVSSPPRPDV